MRKDVRVWFSKTGTARYISHLDLNRCMSRAFHKAKLPLWYTEGFNPHVFGLPHDIRVWAVTEPEMKGNDVANAEYILRLECEDPAFEKSEMQRVLAEPELTVKKHSKKGEKIVDIKPYFENMTFEEKPNCLEMTVRLPAGNQGGINPTLFVDAAERVLNRELLVRVERTRLFDSAFREFK